MPHKWPGKAFINRAIVEARLLGLCPDYVCEYNASSRSKMKRRYRSFRGYYNQITAPAIDKLRNEGKAK